jgi:hypothetical protein
MASGHMNRTNRPNTWPQPTSCTVKRTLANTEPSTHGTKETYLVLERMALFDGRAEIRRCRRTLTDRVESN